MAKDDRHAVNPFTGKKHFDMVDDDEFLAESYNYYYNEINRYEILDNTPQGQMVLNVTTRLVQTVHDYLNRIGRFDYVEDYYDWEVHLVNSDIVNACCYPGGKIIVYAGILQFMEYEDELAFVLSHEVSHALLDHSRTSASVNKAKNTISNFSWMGSMALDMLGFHEAGELTRAAVNLADVGSHYFLTEPWGRDHELEADKLGLIIAYLAGFNVNIVPEFWQRFSGFDGNDFDFFSTHPSDDKRIAVMRESLYEISNDDDFYSKPLLEHTPKPKDEFKGNNFTGNVKRISENRRFEQKMSCPKCGYVTGSDDKFCMQCGFNLKGSAHCTSCGYKVNASDNFCMNCGKKL